MYLGSMNYHINIEHLKSPHVTTLNSTIRTLVESLTRLFAVDTSSEQRNGPGFPREQGPLRAQAALSFFSEEKQ